MAEVVAELSRTLTGTCWSLAPCIRYTVHPAAQPESSSVKALPSLGSMEPELVIWGLATTPEARARTAVAAATEYFMLENESVFCGVEKASVCQVWPEERKKKKKEEQIVMRTRGWARW